MTADKTLSCRDCSSSFTWTGGEQDYFASKGFNPPSRCPSCRSKRSQMSGGNRSQQSAPVREMFDAFCQVGNHTVRVPFQVDSNRPWACRDHKDQAKAAREASMHEVYCDAGGHMTKVPLSFSKDDSRPWQCRDCKKAGIELPRYNYTCAECPTTFTTTRQLDETRWLRCPQCQEDHKNRMAVRNAGMAPYPGTGSSSAYNNYPGIGRVKKDPGPGSMMRPQRTFTVQGIGSFSRGRGKGRFG